jgi:sulfatase modifying factor 1
MHLFRTMTIGMITLACWGFVFPPSVALAIGPNPPPEIRTNSIGMKLALIPAGEFLMGAPASDADAGKDEFPQHRVKISRPFHMGIHEVSVDQFRAFVDATGHKTSAETEPSSGFDPETLTFRYNQPGFHWRHLGWPQTGDHPVLNVTWFDATAFCDWLSKKEGRTYRLPTEAEWEYACRAGTEARYIRGLSIDHLRPIANLQDKSLAGKKPRFSNSEASSYLTRPVPWDDGYPFSAPAGSFKPNGFGLHDMLGNAAEWCQDWYGADYYGHAPAANPPGPEKGEGRVVRGGAFLHQARHCRVTMRTSGTPTYHNYIIGFRVILEVGEKK